MKLRHLTKRDPYGGQPPTTGATSPEHRSINKEIGLQLVARLGAHIDRNR